MRFLITYSIENFYFHIYHEDFYGLSNNILHVLGTQVISIENSQLESDNVIRYKQCAQVMEGLLSIQKEFSHRIGDEKTLFVLIINLPSLARIACIVLHCLIQVANSHRNN